MSANWNKLIDQSSAAFFDVHIERNDDARVFYCAKLFPTAIAYKRTRFGKTSWHFTNFMHAEAARADFYRHASWVFPEQ